MSGRWVSTGGKGRVWVNDGDQLFLVTYRSYVAAPDADAALRKTAGTSYTHGGDWTATPVPAETAPRGSRSPWGSTYGIRNHRPMTEEQARLAKMAAEATSPVTRGQLALPEAMIDRVHGRVQSDLAEPESSQVRPDEQPS